MLQARCPLVGTFRNCKLVSEGIGGGQVLGDYSVGKEGVSAPAVCRGRPTFKYTRIEVAGVLERLAAGHAIEALISDSRGRLSRDAIAEAATLAAKALARQAASRTSAT